MVNTANKIEGRKITEHPLSGGEMPVMPVMKDRGSFLAVMAIVGGVCSTKDGARRFQAGDYILTDDPPTSAFVVNAQAFRAQYHPAGGQPPHAVPEPAAPAVVEETKRQATTNRAAAKVPAKPKTRTGRPMAGPKGRAKTTK